MFKKIDIFLIRAFIAPFAVAFGIAMFVLVMQFLWVYIDEIMGKGLNILQLTELIFYLSMTIIPSALPIGVLIASVMLMGNLAERYELSSFKSAGVSLLRVLRPLMLLVACITLFSIYCSDRIIPWANLQFYSRFYDIRKAKPTLTMVEGIFNDEFQEYTIRIGKKASDGRTLGDVRIYANKGANMDYVNQNIAKRGEMYNAADNQFIVMNLFDGTQYQEPNGGRRFPFVRIEYESWKKVFDLSQFQMGKTDINLFGSHRKMLPIWKLANAVDSIRRNVWNVRVESNLNFHDYFQPLKMRQKDLRPSWEYNAEALHLRPKILNIADSTAETQQRKILGITQAANAAHAAVNDYDLAPRKHTAHSAVPVSKIYYPPTRKFADTWYHYYDTLEQKEKNRLLSRVETTINGIKNQAQSSQTTLRAVSGELNQFQYELYLKYASAIICLIFLFIGAPMGAIVQKGGFGYPILIAIIFFTLYVIMNTYFKGVKDTLWMSGALAAWMPCLLMLPVAAILTYRAMNDYKVMDIEAVRKRIQTFMQRYLPKPLHKKTEIDTAA